MRSHAIRCNPDPLTLSHNPNMINDADVVHAKWLEQLRVVSQRAEALREKAASKQAGEDGDGDVEGHSDDVAGVGIGAASSPADVAGDTNNDKDLEARGIENKNLVLVGLCFWYEGSNLGRRKGQWSVVPDLQRVVFMYISSRSYALKWLRPLNDRRNVCARSRV